MMGSRLPGPMSVQKQLATWVCSLTPGISLCLSPSRGRVDTTRGRKDRPVFFSLALRLLGPAATRLCKREMQKFQALGPSSPGQASFFPHIIKDPLSNIVGASSSAHLFGFSRSPACAGLGAIIPG